TVRAHTDYLTMNTKQRTEIVRITDDVARAVGASGVQEGLCLVSAMHITAGIYVNDDEPGFRSDLMAMLEEIAPLGADYEHHKTEKDITVRHLVSVEGVMRRLAQHFNEDEHAWGLTGLFHDLDQDATAGDAERHAYLAAEWLREAGEDEVVVNGVLAHAHPQF